MPGPVSRSAARISATPARWARSPSRPELERSVTSRRTRASAARPRSATSSWARAREGRSASARRGDRNPVADARTSRGSSSATRWIVTLGRASRALRPTSHVDAGGRRNSHQAPDPRGRSMADDGVALEGQQRRQLGRERLRAHHGRRRRRRADLWSVVLHAYVGCVPAQAGRAQLSARVARIPAEPPSRSRVPASDLTRRVANRRSPFCACRCGLSSRNAPDLAPTRSRFATKCGGRRRATHPGWATRHARSPRGARFTCPSTLVTGRTMTRARRGTDRRGARSPRTTAAAQTAAAAASPAYSG